MARRATQPAGQRRDVRFEVAEVDPTDAGLDLIVAGMFEVAAGCRLTGGVPRFDERMGGTLVRLRAGGIFGGRIGETMTLTRPAAPLRARAILLVGLGDGPAALCDGGERVAELAMRSAMRMRVRSVGCLLGWPGHDLPPRLAVVAAAALMRGALNAADRPEPAALPLRWIFDGRGGAGQYLARALRRALNARS